MPSLTPAAASRLDRAKFLFDLYGGDVDFGGIEMVEVRISLAESRITLTFEPGSPPPHIPNKWREKSFDTALVVLSFLDLQRVEIARVTPGGRCWLMVDWVAGRFGFATMGDTVLSGAATFGYVTEIRGCRASERGP